MLWNLVRLLLNTEKSVHIGFLGDFETCYVNFLSLDFFSTCFRCCRLAFISVCIQFPISAVCVKEGGCRCRCVSFFFFHFLMILDSEVSFCICNLSIFCFLLLYKENGEGSKEVWKSGFLVVVFDQFPVPLPYVALIRQWYPNPYFQFLDTGPFPC